MKPWSYATEVLRHKHTRHPAVCLCEYCGKTFTTLTNMKTHQRKNHMQRHIKTHKDIMETQNTEVDVDKVPGVAYSFSCPTCEQAFTRKDHLTRHINAKHLKIKYPCPDCWRVFTRKDARSQHMKTHKDIMETQNTEVDVDMKTHKDIMETQNTEVDVDKVTGGAYSFSCPTCDRSFTRKTRLTRHINAKHLKIKYPCPNCWRVFTRKDTLSQHMKTHKNIIVERVRSSEECDLASWRSVWRGQSKVAKTSLKELEL